MSIDRLTAEDELMLRWDDRWPQDMGALAFLEGGALIDAGGRFRIERVRERIEARLHLVPRFRQVVQTPRNGLGGPLWVDAPHFDVQEHVHVLPQSSPAGLAEVLAVVEKLRRQRFEPRRPRWEMWFMPGLPDGRVAWFVKLNHSIADGMAAMTALGAFLDSAPGAPPEPAQPWTPVPPPSERDLRTESSRSRSQARSAQLEALAHPLATLRKARGAWPAIRELVFGQPPPRTSLNRWIGEDRAVALIRSELPLFKQIAHAHGATVNDVLLAMAAGGLRALLQRRGESVETLRLPIYVPISLRQDKQGSAQGNLIAQMVVPLELAARSPAERIRLIAAETAERKARKRYDLGTFFRGAVATWLMLRALERKPVNVTTANVPGPSAPLYFAGARILEMFPLIPLIANIALGVGALSYAGAFNIAVVADRKAYPDLAVFVAGAEAELGALTRRSHHEASRKNAPVPGAEWADSRA